MAKEINLERLTFKTCPECGEHFRPAATLAQKYCSMKCKDRHAYRKKITGEEVSIGRCEYCDKPYIKKKPKDHYCSEECKAAVDTKLKAEQAEKDDKQRRKLGQTHIDEAAAEAKAAGITYGQLKARQCEAESILDQDWARELIKNRQLK